MAQPTPPPTRGSVGTRNLLAAILPLVLIVLALVAFAGQCSVSPGGPDTDAAVAPSVDADAELRRFAGTVDFPVRVPAVPADWRASTARTDRVDTGGALAQVVRTGWLVPAGGYVQLSQSPAAEADLVRAETGREAAATGAVPVGELTWVAYPGRRSEVAWVADLGVVRLLVTGSADEDTFRALASAAVAARPLPA